MRAICFALLLLAAGCGTRGHVWVADDVPEANERVEILVASNRVGDGLGDNDEAKRGDLHYAAYEVATPPADPRSGIRTMRYGRDPARNFVLTRAPIEVNPDEVRRYLSSRLRLRPRDEERNILFYVHGYNNTFAEGLYRFAQIDADVGFNGVAVHFSWPSRGTVAGYAYDRESALYSRNDLREALRNAALAGPGSIIIMAHSMGSFLTMEALARMAESGRDQALLDKIGVIYLSAADIDVDVFRRLAMALPVKLRQRMLVFHAGQDRVLRLSGFLRGESGRVGSSTDPDEDFAGLKIHPVDVSEFSDNSDNHNIVAGTAAVVKFQHQIINNPALARSLLDSIPAEGGHTAGATLSTKGTSGTVHLLANRTKEIVRPIPPDTGTLPPKSAHVAGPL